MRDANRRSPEVNALATPARRPLPSSVDLASIVEWRLSTSERNCLHSIAHICVLTDGGSGHCKHQYPTRVACFADLCDHAVRLMRRRERHGLR